MTTSTNELRPVVPSGAKLYGFIYTSEDKETLSEDMLDVVLSNGVLITAGWYADPGKYRVSACHGFVIFHDSLYSDTAEEALSNVKVMIARYSK